MATPTAVNGSSLSHRNWKCVPTGSEIDDPARTELISSIPPNFRHIRPLPETKNQISSMVLCATATEIAPGPREKCAILPRDALQRMRTSEPSGAIASGSLLICLVSKVISFLSWREKIRGINHGWQSRGLIYPRCDFTFAVFIIPPDFAALGQWWGWSNYRGLNWLTYERTKKITKEVDH